MPGRFENLCRYSFAIAIAIAGGYCASTAAAQQNGARQQIEWLTGTDLARQLDQKFIDWDRSEGLPLRESLVTFSQLQRVAVMLDRRVDPGRPLKLTLNEVSLGSAFAWIAERQSLGLCWIGPVAYFGPPETTDLLATVVELRKEEAGKLPPDLRRRWTATAPTTWPDLATPRELLSQLADELECQVDGTDHIPHDLWASADLPPLSGIERLSLILGQFDLTFAFEESGARIALVPFPDEAFIVRSYPGGSNVQARMTELAAKVPEARFAVVAGRIQVRGTVQQHQRIRQALTPQTAVRTPGATTKKIDALTVENKPLGPVLKALAQGLGLRLSLDEAAIAAADVSLEQLISFEVKDATIDETFTALLKPTGLSHRLRGEVLEVFPAR